MNLLQQDAAEKIPVKIKNLDFSYAKTFGDAHDTPVLHNVSVEITRGQRCLVVGGNGAGKSTLLRIIAGKHLVSKDDSALVFGRDSFRDTMLNHLRTYISSEWGQRSVAFSSNAMAYSADIAVKDMMTELQATYPERRDQLAKVLRIDPTWRMCKVSDGQRRRVQLFLALIRPSKLVILDEVLGLLDIIAREDFLQFLQEESDNNGVTIILATNVFDGLTNWASHIVYLRQGQVIVHEKVQENADFQRFQAQHQPEPLLRTVEFWLRQETQKAEPESGTSKFEFEIRPRAGGYADGRLGDFEEN